MNKFKEILFLKSIRGVGKSAIYTKYFETLKNSEGLNELKKLLSVKYSEDTLAEAERKAGELYDRITSYPDINIITVFDEQYPEKLNVMGNKRPLILYVKGNVEALKKDSISIIGTRKPSRWSMAVEESLVNKILELSDRAIISGLALGCDKIAHETTVNAKRTTIAVMPCGVNVITPPAHKQLAEEIIKTGGCLVSEYEPDMTAFTPLYVERDAIVAALSDINFVVECDVKSGTMHTVEAAYEYKKVIGCYYPEDMSKGSYGGNYYIVEKKGGVKVSDTEDLKNLLNGTVTIIDKTEDKEPEQMTIFDIIKTDGNE